MDTAQLLAWYSRHGFKVTNGYYIDREARLLLSVPKDCTDRLPASARVGTERRDD